jgi:hypothetical protein
MEIEIPIIYLDKKEKVTKFISESDHNFNTRIELIKLMEKDNILWKEAHKLSKIWYNIKLNNAKYNSELYKKYLHYNDLLTIQSNK